MAVHWYANVLTNVIFLPAIIHLYRRKRKSEASLTALTGLCSTMYHICERSRVPGHGFCTILGLPEGWWHRGDNFCVTLGISVLISDLSTISRSYQLMLMVPVALISAYRQITHPWNLMSIIYPLALTFAACGYHDFRRKRIHPGFVIEKK